MPNSRITKAGFLAASALSGALRVTAAHVTFVAAMPGPLRVTRVGLYMGMAIPGAIRVTYVSLIKAQSIHRVFYLGRLPSTSTITSFIANGPGNSGGGDGNPPGHGWELELVAGIIPEFNPYKPQVPESLIKIDDGGREIFDWLEEQQKTIRLQHNITQVGDTTFPYQMIINTHTDKQFTLGSVGKFYHEDYGMILARYVRFEKMNTELLPPAPMGLLKKTKFLEWVVTNRLELSSPYLCVGVNASYVLPKDGEYGWVIVDGVNLQQMPNTSDSAVVAEAFVWSASGEVKNEGIGTIIARRINEPTDTKLLRGQAWIRLESLSEGAVVEALDQYIQIINQLVADVEELQAAVGIGGALDTLQSQITVLQARLSAEENARRAADNAINTRIDNLNFVTEAQLNAAIHNVETALATVAAALQSQIDAVNDIAVEALQKANQALSINVDFILEQLSLMLDMIAALNLRAKGKFPVVDGAVPPNLVYLDDGTLVYEETF